jgi:6-phosphogluconolactonase
MRSRIAAVLAWMSLCAVFALPAAAQAAGSAYVVTSGTSNISQFAIRADGGLSPLSPATLATGGGANGAVVSPEGRSAYFTGDSGVFQYDVNAHSGALSPKTPAAVPEPAGTLGTYDVAVTPDGKRLYAAGSEPHGGSHILHYDIDSHTGALSLKPGGVGTGFVPGAIAVTPDGENAYVTSIFQGALQFDIDPTSGALSPKTPANVPTGQYPESVAVAPDGRSAYFGNFNNSIPNNSVAQFDIDPADGSLSPKAPATVVTGPYAEFIAITPDSRSAYVSSVRGIGSSDPGSVWQYDIDPASGALSPKTPATVQTGGRPAGIAVTPDGRTAYIANSADSYVWQYKIDPASGTLSPKSPPTVETGGTPSEIALGPLPRKPTGKEQCEQGGWRNFPQFKNQGQCVAFFEPGK